MATYPTVSTGTGPDRVTLQISEDAWRNKDGISDAEGNARFTAFVNDQQIGGTFTAVAPHRAAAEQVFQLNGTFGQNPTLGISFINDASGGPGGKDRNLYVDSVNYNGVDQHDTAALLTNRTVSFQLAGGTPPPPPPPSGTAFYVAVNGNDANNGSEIAPFRTVARAQQAMQQSTTKITNIQPGTYSLGQWKLTSADSGETWRPAQGQGTVTLDGAGSGYVDASGVTGLTVEGLTFQNMGVGPHGSGMYLNGSNETIRWNTFLNSKQEAITGANLQNSLIDSNTIDGVSPGNPPGVTTFAYTAIDFWFGSSGNTISHNLIQNTQGGGISVATGASDPPINNNVIDSNKLVNVNTSVFDIGAIYLEDRTHRAVGNKITNNVINGYGNGSLSDQTKGIYLDDVVSNVTITGNLLYGKAGEWGLQFHGGDHDVVQNNIFALAPGEQLGLYQDYTGSTGMNGNDFERNIVYYQGQPPSSLWHVSGTGMALPRDTANLYYAADGSTVPNNVIVDTNPTVANPQFQNPSGGDYSLPPTSPAFSSIGWQALSTDQGPLPYQP